MKNKLAEKNKYYLATHKHIPMGEHHWLFWKPDGNGYTYNLEEAGLYEKDYSKIYPIVHRRENRFKHETFYVRQDKIQEILGKIQTCVVR